MPAALLHPGVYIEEVPSGVRTITGVGTSTALFIGWALKGPTDRAVRITSYADYERNFGSLHPDSFLGYGVRQFYANGGSDAYVLRVAATGAGGTTAAVAAFKAIDGLTVTASSSGLWGNNLKIKPTGAAASFRLDVLDAAAGDALLESFVNLSMTPTDLRFAPAVINGNSAYVTVARTSGTVPGSTQQLTGGLDGTTLTPGMATFNSAVTGPFATGAIVDRIDIFNILCVPGLTDKVTIDTLQTAAKGKRAFLLVDAPSGALVSTVAGAGALPIGTDAANSAFYFPWVLAPDPLQSDAIRPFPPSGFVAGILARTDAARGVWKAPAGTDASISGAAGLTITMSDLENGQLNPKGVNCLRTLPVYGTVVWGARTLHGDNDRGSEWKYVPVRRTALFLEESLYRGTQWVVFEPNDEPLWAQIRLNIGAFLQSLFRQGAFQGKTPKEAYFVKCDRETTTQDDINKGIVNILVGFAPLKPAEFVVIKIQQMAGDIQT
jgi:phage tail sheath protein FI